MKTLQLEQLAVTGSAEEPSVVSSRMQLVFSTLEVGHFFKISTCNLDYGPSYYHSCFSFSEFS